MVLELHRMSSEADLAEFHRLQTAAFTFGIPACVAPSPLPANWTEISIGKHVKSFQGEPDCHFLKVIDTELGGRIVAAAKWRINHHERTTEEIQKQLPKPKEDDHAAAKDFINFLIDSRLEFMGTKPFYLLHILVTDPEHSRRGAGAMLVKWGMDQADKAQLPTYLESSSQGKRLYERLGFKVVKETTFDLTKYGKEGTDIGTVMIKDPAPLSSA
ncbi:hypothetical protein P154DRAFT_520120 [Amniculicola lignicola CBS 123094]|uniref:N-acetyltransferase domain-containing protein n=1 Tax=Amniculicola lignicola CBS 123094 TaxID=1392246 RepID=A0A6A5WRI3_9PLEO|nr:hypothetical protein P154DRAFT_520120 [Amniculicola lignicola CBS 123094]